MLSDCWYSKRYDWHIDSLNPCSNGICSLTNVKVLADSIRGWVLILVLMEYALWLFLNTINHAWNKVLILVLMEYALWLKNVYEGLRNSIEVLILVLMEYALWPRFLRLGSPHHIVLILVLMEYALWRRAIHWLARQERQSLNPCSNGICSLTIKVYGVDENGNKVLILVLMEYALWPSY